MNKTSKRGCRGLSRLTRNAAFHSYRQHCDADSAAAAAAVLRDARALSSSHATASVWVREYCCTDVEMKR